MSMLRLDIGSGMLRLSSGMLSIKPGHADLGDSLPGPGKPLRDLAMSILFRVPVL